MRLQWYTLLPLPPLLIVQAVNFGELGLLRFQNLGQLAHRRQGLQLLALAAADAEEEFVVLLKCIELAASDHDDDGDEGMIDVGWIDIDVGCNSKIPAK